MIGTMQYSAPEVLQGLPYNYKSDMWQLGVIYYEMVQLKLFKYVIGEPKL